MIRERYGKDITELICHAVKEVSRDAYGGIENGKESVPTDAIAAGTEPKAFRNCGAKRVREIMERLFLFHYHSLPEEKRESYLPEDARVNKEAC